MQNRLFSILKYALGWPFSILALFFIIKLVAPRIPEFTSKLYAANPVLLMIGIFSFLVYYFLRSYIWHRLLKVYSNKITYKQSAYHYSVSEFKRYIPGSIVSFLGRAFAFSEQGIPKKNVGKLIVTEAGIFVIGCAVISLLSLPFVLSSFSNFVPDFSQKLIIFIVLIGVLLYIFFQQNLKFIPKFERSENANLVALSTCALLWFGVANYFVISSVIILPIELFFQLSGFFVLSVLIGYLSLLTPAGFGVREGIIIAGLSKIVNSSIGAFIALFSRIILIISEIIFLGITYLYFKSKSKKVSQLSNLVANHKHEAVLLGLIIIYIAYFSWISFLRYDHFYTGRFDLGNMAQTVWNTTQGRIFQFTNPDGADMVSRLAFHADFLLILLAPFYALFPNPKTLLFIQTFVVALGSIFVYLIAKDKLTSKNLSLAFAFAYLINPSVQRANLYDFHAVTLATTFLLGTYYFYSRKKYVLFMIFALLAAISKEQIWLIIALFGVMLFFNHKKRLFGSLIFFVSFGIFYYLISVAIPQALGASHFAIDYYSDFGDGPLSIAKNILFSPQKVFEIIYQKEKIDYLAQLFSPLGYLSFIYPFFLILAGADLTINLLSNNAQLHQIYYQYTAAITPFIFISAIFGMNIIKKYIEEKYLFVLPIFILITSLMSAYKLGVLPGSKDANLEMINKQLPDYKFLEQKLSDIPPHLSVAASNNVGSHLAHRLELFTLPLGLEKADVLVFYPNKNEQPQSLIAQKLQLEKIRHDNRYEIITEKGSFVIFRKKNVK
ncbi:MAG TPA: DUF2079 domain-containing protein [Candidatus Limnocylindrales bacterium]|nr:DUF2079 domain-containing protein [Candidatus Limnocylindrales bacterium]